MSNADHLASAVRSRRLELGISTVKELAAAGSFTPKTASAIENGRKDSYRPSTRDALDRVLQWAPGSAQHILDGDEPTLLPALPSRDTLDTVDVPDGDSAGDLDDDEIAEVESVARAAALKRKREILAARRVTTRPQRDNAHADDAGEEPQA